MAKKKLLPKRSNYAHIFIVAGVLLFLLGAYNYYKLRVLSFSRSPNIVTTPQRGDLPVHITIPSVKIDQPIESAMIKDGIWEISYDQATFLNTSARPGGGGNIVIYGHNKKAIFGSLPYLGVGQKIFIKTEDGKVYVYEVTTKDFVPPDRMDLVSPTNYEELTIYTCWGALDRMRVVVKAKPVID